MGIDLTEPALDRLIAEHSPDLHVVTSVAGLIRYVSPASPALSGWPSAALVGRQQDGLAHPDDVANLRAARQRAAAEPGRPVRAICRFRRADGAYRWTEALARLAGCREESLLVWAVRDIGERKQAELDLQRRASTDPLTGVANRTVFMDRLHQALRRLDRRDGLVAVLFLDLDRFKLINDSLGHLIGDSVLLQMAERLRGFLRPQDTLARLGGDEFAVVAEDMSWAGEAVALGDRIVEAGRAPFTVGEEQFSCTTSVGIAVATDAQHSAERLLQEADLAMYRAKDRGRDRAEVFGADLRVRAVGRLGTERMLRRAIDEDRLRVEFQPIVALATGRTVAVEALVRVWDPTRGQLVAAAEFIEVAEEAGLLARIDDWVLSRALQQAATWQQMFGGTDFADMSVNLTARHLADPGFAQSVIDTLAARGVPSAKLQIEVTERVLMEASNSAMSGLRVLRDAGVQVGLDDFGTGYSSLSYLRLFPLDFIKIDQSFIGALAPASSARAIVGSVIDLSHTLGMAVVAEGVETQAQVDALVSLGCDRAQGYRYAPAGPAGVIERLVLASGSAPGPV